MVKLITLKWSDAKGEGSVKPVKGFDDLHRVIRLDALSDWISDLTKMYEEILEDENK
jgi:hypothetical protein